MQPSERHKTVWYIAIFSVLVALLAWAAPALGGTPSEPGLGFVVWGIAPLLVALVLRFGTKDWADAGFKPALRKHAVWYLVSFFAYPLMMILTLLVGQVLSISSLSEFSLGQYLQTAFLALPFFLIFAFFEEVGWRGYLAPKLVALGINSYLAAAFLALIWTLWHVPYLRELTWVYSAEDLLTFIPRYYLVLFAFAVLYGEIREITGSFWPAVLMHGVNNAFGHPLAADYVTIAAGQESIASVSTGFIMIIFILILGVMIRYWRTKHLKSSREVKLVQSTQ